MPYAIMDSPVGYLTLVTDASGALTSLTMHAEPTPGSGEEGGAGLDRAAAQLGEYFAGERRTFDLPLAPHGTDFQHRVWQALGSIEFGQTRSYGEIAAQIGQPTASRAVGLANGRNPISIVVPCHRVVGASGALTGYAHGVERKRWLLAHEQGQDAPRLSFP